MVPVPRPPPVLHPRKSRRLPRTSPTSSHALLPHHPPLLRPTPHAPLLCPTSRYHYLRRRTHRRSSTKASPRPVSPPRALPLPPAAPPRPAARSPRFAVAVGWFFGWMTLLEGKGPAAISERLGSVRASPPFLPPSLLTHPVLRASRSRADGTCRPTRRRSCATGQSRPVSSHLVPPRPVRPRAC